MNFYKLLHLAFGEYRYSLPCSDFAALSADITKKRINVWGIKHQGDAVTLSTSLITAEILVNLCESRGITLTEVRNIGLPFIFSRYRRRIGLLLGGAVFMALIFISQLFIWKIEISGNERMTTRELELALESVGVSVGSFIPKIDRLEKSNELLLEYSALSSVSISLNGTHVSVSVIERRAVPEPINDFGFYNVVADCDGVILDIDAEMGTPEVREGEAVYKGELLINSFMELRNGGFKATHARGRVYAAVNEKIEIEIPMNRRAKVYSGRVQTKRAYRVLGARLFGWSDTESGYEYFDTVATERDITLFGFIELPIREYKLVYREYNVLYSEIDTFEAEELLMSALEDEISLLDCEVLSIKSEIFTDEEKGVCRLKADAVIKRDIAVEVPYELIRSPKG